MIVKKQVITDSSTVSNEHPDFARFRKPWERVRDCLAGEDVIKAKEETYLPRPAGMSGEYADAYDNYLERAHFPLVAAYALSGALGIVITKLPEFNVPKELEYILKEATKDGRSLQQLFLDIIIEVFQTGRVPVLVDVIEETNEFRFVQYKAEELINWKTSTIASKKSLILGVLAETMPESEDIFSHDTETVYRVLYLDENGKFASRIYTDDIEVVEFSKVPKFMGNTINEIPLTLAGSINNSFDMQPIPLISVANCSIQIYRKEADLANSEFMSCNPTLCMVGVSNEDELPNVVGSSVMLTLQNDQARVFYTETDTAALSHVKTHITDLYEEAIRHGVAILDARKGVEAAEALRIRQSTQSASIYSVYLAALNALKQGLITMCRWAGYDETQVIVDAPASLTQGIPDSAVLKAVVEGFGKGVVPLAVIHRYLVDAGLIDQKTGYQEYVDLLRENKILVDNSEEDEDNADEDLEDEDLKGEEEDEDDKTKKEDDNKGGTKKVKLKKIIKKKPKKASSTKE